MRVLKLLLHSPEVRGQKSEVIKKQILIASSFVAYESKSTFCSSVLVRRNPVVDLAVRDRQASAWLFEGGGVCPAFWMSCYFVFTLGSAHLLYSSHALRGGLGDRSCGLWGMDAECPR